MRFKIGIATFAVFALFVTNANAFFFSHDKKELEKEEAGHCSATKEYVTALEFLRDNKSLAGSEAKARWVADEISKNCTGAAKRFIQIAGLLKKIEISNEELLKMSMNAAKSTNEKTESFKIIFSKAYFKEELDLDVYQALQIANDLSFNFIGESKWAKDQFVSIVNYCTKTSASFFSNQAAAMYLNKIDCAKLASSLIDAAKTEPRHIADDFIAIYEFLLKQKMKDISSTKAIEIAKAVVVNGSIAKQNFLQAFEYASKKNGLDMDTRASLDFAQKMASRSSKL